MVLTDRQWQRVLPIIRGGAKELEISIDSLGNAFVVGKGEGKIVSLNLRGNVIPFPKTIHATTTIEKYTLKDRIHDFLDFLGIVLWGEEEDYG